MNEKFSVLKTILPNITKVWLSSFKYYIGYIFFYVYSLILEESVVSERQSLNRDRHNKLCGRTGKEG